MRKLCINLFLIFGINFSVFGSDSERHAIYEEENAKFDDQKRSHANPIVPFDRATRLFGFEGSREGLDEIWFVNSQRVSTNDLYKFDEQSLKHPGVTCCYVNMTKLAHDKSEEEARTSKEILDEFVIMVVHTKYDLNPNHPDYLKRLAEAQAYAQRVERYNGLTKKERKKQMQEHLKRDQSNEQPTTGNNKPAFSKVWSK